MGVKIIAEAGVNHNGDIGLAKELIEVAADSGADVVKFQTFKADNLVTRDADKAEYQKVLTGADESQFEMLERLELKHEDHFTLIEHCKNHKIEFFSTAFDVQSLIFLTQILNVNYLKIPSGEITNGPFVVEHARTGKNVIISTGMSTLSEVEAALGALAYGYTKGNQPITDAQALSEAFSSKEGQQAIKEKVTLLHCTSQYPAPFNSVNLKAMDTLAETFGLPVGYSDHTEGILVSIAAVARGASVIEKHFTLDKTMQGPDHTASLDPKELKEMIQGIRIIERTLGSGKKEPDESELSTRSVARKSLVAGKDINKGDVFTSDNIRILRPGTGLAPNNFWSLLGSKSGAFYKRGDLLE